MKDNRGITLIALIITIIVISLIATVSINAAVGENGIIDRSMSSKRNSELSSVAGEIQDAVRRMEYYEIASADRGITIDSIFNMGTLQKYLAGKLNGLYKRSNDETIIYYTTDDGIYTVGIKDGEITTVRQGILLYEDTIQMIQIDVDKSGQLFSTFEGITTWVFVDDTGAHTSEYDDLMELNPDGTFKKKKSGLVIIRGWNEDHTKYVEVRLVDYIPQLDEEVIATDEGDMPGEAFPGVPDVVPEPIPAITLPEGSIKLGDNVYGLVTEGNTFRVFTFGEGEGKMEITENYDENEWIYFPEVKSITNLVIDDGVTELMRYSFCNFDNVTFLSIPATITSIGYTPFTRTGSSMLNGEWRNFDNGIRNLDTLYYNHRGDSDWSTQHYGFQYTNVKNVIIGNEVPYIQYGTFSDCRLLTDVSIPDSVTSIKGYAFNNCESLANVNITSNITNIDLYAFSNTGLKNVSLPDSVIQLGAQTFSKCNKLESINFGNGITVIPGSVCYNCTELSSVILSNKTTEINNSAFSGSNKLTEFTIPESVTRIVGRPLGDCPNLKTIYYNATNATYINGTAYSWAGTNFSTIYAYDEDYASSLTGNYKLELYRSAGRSDYVAPFYITDYSSDHNTVYVRTYDRVARYASIRGSSYSYGSGYTYSYSTSSGYYDYRNRTSYSYGSTPRESDLMIYYPPGNRMDGSMPEQTYLYYYNRSTIDLSKNNLEEVIFGDSVQKIPDNMFKGNNNLKRIELSSSIKAIGKNAFKDCVSLETIAYKDGIYYSTLQNIDKDAFKNCISLQRVYLPKNIASINVTAFDCCYSMQELGINDVARDMENYPWGLITPSNAGNKEYTYFSETKTMYAPGANIIWSAESQVLNPTM